MKKFLSVALALAMTLSLVVVGASAKDFTDNSKINYKEAVDVVSAVKIIDGYTDGSFNPTATLTRGAAAKIICNMILGPTVANALGVSTAPFKDVATSNVFAGYIAYCAKQGIINGYADKTFKPAGTVTGYQFLKMLLGALGYDGKIEGFSGSNWEVNVAKLATNIGLYDGNSKFVGTAAMTREEACQYAFNTLKSTMVEYANKGSEITINGVTISQGASKATDVTIKKDLATIDGTVNTEGTVQFAEQYFKALSLTASASDNFKRPAHTWTYGNTTVGMYKTAPVVTYNNGASAATVAKDLAGYTLNGKKVNNVDTYGSASKTVLTSSVYTNGATGELAVAANKTSTIAAAIAGATGTGLPVEIYANSSNEITKIVVVQYTVGTVTGVTTNTTGTTYTITPATNISISGVDYVDNSSNTDTIVLNGKVAKGDIVTYAVAGGVTYVYPTTMVSGAQTAKSTSDETVTVGGKTYSVATGVTGVDMANFANSTKTANYYLDQFGNVVTTTASASYTDYAYVVGAYGYVTGSVNGYTPAAQVKVALADGSVKTYTLKLTAVTAAAAGTGYTTFNSGVATAYTAVAGDYVIDGSKMVVYKAADKKDSTNLTAQVAALEGKTFGYGLTDTTISMNTLNAASTSMTSGSVYFDTAAGDVKNTTVNLAGENHETILCNSSTVFVVYNTSADTAKVYTGASSLPTTALTGTKSVVLSASSANVGIAKVVYLSTATAVAAETTSYAYINAGSYTEQIVNGATQYVYTGVKADGTKQALTSTTKLNEAKSGVYAYNTDNTINTTAKCAEGDTGIQNTYYAYNAKFVVTSNVINVGGNYYNITADTKIVYVKSTLTEVNDNGGYIVLAASNGTASSNVATIYVTVD